MSAWAAIPAEPAVPLRTHHEAALAAARKALPDDRARQEAFAAGTR